MSVKRFITTAATLLVLGGAVWLLASSFKMSPRRRAFEEALFRGDVQTARMALDQGESVSGYPDEYEYMSPLEQAAGSGHDALVELLLSRGADIHVSSGWGTPLEQAARDGHLSTVKLLIRRGVLEGDRQAELDYALWGAAVEGRVGVVKYLLSCGADPKQQQPGAGSLWAACRTFHQTEVTALLEAAGAKEWRRAA